MSDFDKRFSGTVAELGLFKSKVCDDEERMKLLKLLKEGKPLPAGYTQGEENKNMFYKSEGAGIQSFSSEETMMLVQLKQAKDVKTIKNCALFFTALAAASLLGTVIMLVTLSNLFT